ncbi:hypothetical protein I6N95_25595 [Vagococcus sp. BWB3-3]|uniref:Uncharacterized protein n=1 Tax=Vagococcus allomyrinae TaxID=2794353 RepID=A0A940PI65_9ENTE|nr:hypothetical protein [Vagococcus allomyrinae]MBP1044388.1 hypothetical protein [Vagococcus allomyrinae]
MKRKLMIASLVIASLGLSACSLTTKKQAPKIDETINTLDSSVIYYDQLPENDIVEPE